LKSPSRSVSSVISSRASDAQRKAILHVDGPLLIIAGPGSGKTFTLVERVVYLVVEKKVPTESLFVVTFTEKAARELQTRVSNRLIELNVKCNLNEIYLGTFHSVCLRLLDENREFTRLKRNYAVLDQFDQQYFLFRRVDEYRKVPDAHLLLEPEGSKWIHSAVLLGWINKVGEEALDPEILAKADDAKVRLLGAFAGLYRKHLEEENALDFTGIQSEAMRLLEDHPQVREALRQKFTYLMVDEYQDTNTIQEKILKLLRNDKDNICVVGDDDQGLYRFRGATIRNILEFPSLFPKGACRTVTLDTNYRSHPDIIDVYNRWMDEQDWKAGDKTFRYSKKIVPDPHKEFTSVPSAIRLAAPPEGDWKREILELLHRLKGSKTFTDWNQAAFLFRSVRGDKAVQLARFLEENGIPVYSPRSDQFFEREEIRLMIGALIFLFPQFQKVRKWADDAHLAIWSYYDDRCFAPFAEALRRPENADLRSFVRPVAKRHAALTSNTDYAFSGLFYRLIQFPLFSCYLSEEATSGVDKGRAARNLAAFSSLLIKFESLHHLNVFQPAYLDKRLREFFNLFLRFLADGGLGEYEDDEDYAPSGCVSFLTIHQSKGLEFPVVVVGSMEAVPRKQHSDLDEILERNYLSRPPFEPLDQTKYYDFRRLFYTAFSRTQNLLVLACQEKKGHGATPSKYFRELFYSLPSDRDPAFRSGDITFEPVKEIYLKPEYSFTTHISLFETCPEQYRFYRDLEFAPVRVGAMLFGTLVHQTIEDVHKAVLRGERDEVTADRIDIWFDTNYVLLSKKERSYLAPAALEAARSQIHRYVNREKSHWDRLQEVEVEITLVKDRYILKGHVDLIRGKEDTVELVDFKAEKKPDLERDKEGISRYRRQLEVYAHLVEGRTGRRVSRMHLYYTGEADGNPYISFDKHDTSIEKTMAAFDGVVGRIESRDYRMKKRPVHVCEDCDIRYYCDRKDWTSR
jgi:DNA helicase-2/ATP-dependent DNA helicase PcrA